MNHRVLAATLALLAALAQGAPEPQLPAEIIYSGGEIVTVDDTQPSTEAVAVRDGRIVALGQRDAVMKWRGPHTRLVDLAGHTLIPGFIDAHGHVYNVGIQALSANLLPAPDGGVNDIPALQSALRDWASRNVETATKFGWIIGFGYDDSQLAERRPPTRAELDAVSTDVPVIVIHQSLHLGVLNSRGLALAGITADSADPPGGVIRRASGGREPDGVLEETAFFGALKGVFGRMDAEDSRAMLRAGTALYTRFGYTTAQEGAAGAGTVRTMIAAAEERSLPIDVVAYPTINTAAELIAPPWLSRDYRGHFRIGGAKLVLDGSPQGKTAWLTQPYHVVPQGRAADYSGYGAFTDAEAAGYVEQAYANGWQLLVHANGDAAIDQLLRAVRGARAKYGTADRRTVAIHAQTAREDQVEAFRELGIFPSFFPMHTFYWGDWHRDSVLGPARAANISPTGWALARGMRFSSHHDAPVALPDSMRVLSATVNRVTRSGQVLGPAQRVSALDALKAQTLWAAWQHFEEDSKGSIRVGKLADLVILDRNPLAVDPADIAAIRVLETIKEGVTVYRLESGAGMPAP